MFSRTRALFSVMGKWERWALLGFGVLFVLSLTALLHKFRLQNTILIPTEGGTYIEGSVGKLAPLNPWFTVQNDVNRDIVSLVFAGLLKYNPQFRRIEPDLATLQVSADQKVYTVTLKEGLQWQDSTKQRPHPVTADDILFTFQTAQAPDFPSPLMRQNFQGVKIEKIDDRTVRFTLDRPYHFFPSNLTLGLLPKASFVGLPPSKMDQTVDFGLAPIGAGPYRLKSVVESELSTEVTLERFDRPGMPRYHLDRVVFRIFPDYSTLLSDIRNMGGVRLVPRNAQGQLMMPKGFTPVPYTLPQYVALFLNMDRKPLKDDKLRLGLQLGTNKQEISDSIHEPHIVDTPLLEIDTSDWRYHFDADAAQGALFASRWFVPERLRLQTLLEHKEANDVGPLHVPPVVLLQTGAVLTLTGSYSNTIQPGSKVNGVSVETMKTNSGAWMATLRASATGALRDGDTMLHLLDKDGKQVDSAYVFRASDRATYARAVEEQQLVSMFLKSKDGTIPTSDKVTTDALFLDNGFLRRRQRADPVSIRRNEKGDSLTLTLLTSPSPVVYKQVADIIKDQWLELGVQVTVVVPPTQRDFERRLLSRDYDVLLFGQSLLDNLDSYPYWHSSAAQHLTGKANDLRRDAYNLSQYTSPKADALLETIRGTTDEQIRSTALAKLREVLKADVPAIFLYSPQYTFAHQDRIQGISVGALSLHSDRFLSLDQWFVKLHRVFQTGVSWWSFFGWLSHQG